MRACYLMLSLCAAGLLIATPVVSQEADMEFRFQVSQPGLGCWFDRQVGQPVMQRGNVVQVDMAVNCNKPKSYRLESTLSTALPVVTESGRWQITSALGQTGDSCAEIMSRPGSAFNHEKDVEVGADLGVTSNWRLCMKAEPLEGQIATVFPVLSPVEIVLSASVGQDSYPEGTQTLDLLFEHNNASLNKANQQSALSWLASLGSEQSYRFELHAHASDSGERQYNHDLSIRRLAETRRFLQAQPAFSNVELWGQAWGEMRLRALNNTAARHAQNRRVVVVAIPLDVPVEVPVEVPVMRSVSAADLIPGSR